MKLWNEVRTQDEEEGEKGERGERGRGRNGGRQPDREKERRKEEIQNPKEPRCPIGSCFYIILYFSFEREYEIHEYVTNN